MIVLLDIGNSRAKYCIVNKGQRNRPQAIQANQLSKAFLSDNFTGVTRLLVASVCREEVTDTIKVWCQTHQVSYQRVISEKIKNRVVSGYTNPSQLGVDRWLTLIGAAELFPNCNILIVDTGTATTVDFLLATGLHQGGWILPGINTIVTSVLANTIQVNAKPLEAASTVFGVNTSENVHNAAWASTVATIDLATRQIEKQGHSLNHIIMTGGNASILSPMLSQPNKVIDDLVFCGLDTYI